MRYLPCNCLIAFISLLAVSGSPLNSSWVEAFDTKRSASSLRPTIRLHGSPVSVIEVMGLSSEELQALARLDQTSDQWQKLLAVFVVREGPETEQPAMLGSFRVSRDALRFEPRFRLVPGVSYRVVFQPSRLPGHAASEAKIEKMVCLPRSKPSTSTVLAHIYPSRDELPENQLKFYLHFSASMSRGEAYEHIHLLGPNGRSDDRAFLELPQELWDRDGKRLTLLIDPGRIKRGLKPREDLGPVLEAGKRYTLVIERDWHDAQGNPLKETFRKSFRVLPPDTTQPDPRLWKLAAPAARTTAPLVMTSAKPLDHALMQRMLWITDARGEKVAGTIEVTKNETCWRFTPTAPWTSGQYYLVADTRLEDLAGNSIARPFEVDELRPVEREAKLEAVRLPFEVK